MNINPFFLVASSTLTSLLQNSVNSTRIVEKYFSGREGDSYLCASGQYKNYNGLGGDKIVCGWIGDVAEGARILAFIIMLRHYAIISRPKHKKI